MAFSYNNKRGDTYYLHERTVELKGSGKKQTIYFFKKEVGKGALEEVPNGFKVIEVKRSGLPLLSRK